MLPIAILAGGQATRLRPLTTTVPKSLVRIAGEPFLAHQLRLLRRSGLERVVLCVGFLGEQIQDFAADGSAFGLDVDYVWDGPSQLGTAGAISKALPLLGDRFFVLHGDSYLTCDYRAVEAAFVATDVDALMTVIRNDNRWDNSNVEYAGGEIVAYDKRGRTPRMQHIDYGLSVFRASALAHPESDGPWDLSALYQDLLRKRRLRAYQMQHRFYEIGSWKGLRELDAYLSRDSLRSDALSRSFSHQYLEEARAIAGAIDPAAVERMASLLVLTRDAGGRLFVLGVGGSAANASHAVSDFRKIAGFEAYAPTDNVSELTARTNDEGWANVFQAWLAGSRLRAADAVLVLSVGGGSVEQNISANLVAALQYARSVSATILGVVGRDGGYTARVADACLVVPTVSADRITPHVEAFQAVICHLLVSHPAIQQTRTKWESVR